MIGRVTAGLFPAPRRWIQRWWGSRDVNARQKWQAVWPQLAALPANRELRVLDAGCGDGTWALELAARRPEWEIVGVDRDPREVARAEDARRRLGLRNVSFAQADFLSFRPADAFDVVLSVASAHYLMEEGRGAELFRVFADWLEPSGTLVVLSPRRGSEVPQLPFLPPPFQLRDVAAGDALRTWSTAAGLSVQALRPAVGRAGTWAKQLAAVAGSSRMLGALTYPLQLALSRFDRLVPPGHGAPSSSWLLVARGATS